MRRTAPDPGHEHAVAVPHTRVEPDVLRRVIVEFVTRDGTDYGAAERSLDAKVADVMRQLGRGEAVLLYDTESDTTNVVQTHSTARHVEAEVIMGDRSPKSKQRDQKQKTAAKASDAAMAKSKQDSHSHVPTLPLKGKR